MLMGYIDWILFAYNSKLWEEFRSERKSIRARRELNDIHRNIYVYEKDTSMGGRQKSWARSKERERERESVARVCAVRAAAGSTTKTTSLPVRRKTGNVTIDRYPGEGVYSEGCWSSSNQRASPRHPWIFLLIFSLSLLLLFFLSWCKRASGPDAFYLRTRRSSLGDNLHSQSCCVWLRLLLDPSAPRDSTRGPRTSRWKKQIKHPETEGAKG